MGRNPQKVEDIVNSNINLQICADIANGLKHGSLNTSRSTHFPKLDRVRVSFTHKALSSVTFRGQEIEFDISKPQDVIFSICVHDRNGQEIGDGFKILSEAITSWENCFTLLSGATKP